MYLPSIVFMFSDLPDFEKRMIHNISGKVKKI